MKYITTFLLFSLLSAFNQASAQYIIHVAGNNQSGFTGDGGLAIKASLDQPVGICRDHAGNLYIADANNGRIRKIAFSTGIITTIAGGGPTTSTGDNILATAANIFGPNGVCLDNIGDLYIADNISRVRKVNLISGIITTSAGMITPGYSGDGGLATAATLRQPLDLAIDINNNIYIADYNNQVIRKVTVSTGIITTVAGVGGVANYNGDGIQATAAALNNPSGVFVDSAFNIFIADQYNNRVRKVDAVTGIISTVAGIGPSGVAGGSFSGDGGPASAAGLNFPLRVTMDKSGNLYISEFGNFRIRKITAATGLINTYAGTIVPTGFIDSFGDGGMATNATMRPYAMCFDSCGNLIFADEGNRIRAITSGLPVGGRLCGYDIDVSIPVMAGVVEGLSIVPNPNTGTFTLNITSSLDVAALITITNMVGQVVRQFTALTNKEQEVQLSGPPGVYFITASTAQGRWSGKMVVE